MSSTDVNIRLTQTFDYGTSADLFSLTNRRGRRQPLNYRRFTSAAEAVRFAVEDLSPQRLMGTYLDVDDARYESEAIQGLYASAHYPLPRKAAADRVG
jgi:Arc/MetJ-type ribon-helix-helix transcriptional regulator